MLLFQKRFHAGLVSGEVRLTFRRWAKPRVKPGGRYRCHPIGVLEVDSISLVAVRSIGEPDAKLAGFATRAEMIEYMRTASEEPLGDKTEVYRVELHHAGDGDRVAVALSADLTNDDVTEIAKRLARLDERGRWTMKTLALIEANPRIAASKLAKQLRRETLELKADIRKLKRLGLTQSFEVGYEVSPRGRAYMAAAQAKKKKRSA